MRLHQVLTGAANVVEDSVAVANGNIAGVPFTVYGSGYEVVILDSHFNRVQILSKHEVTPIVKCIACSNIDGKIAVSFGEKVILYKPQPIQRSSDLKLSYYWHEFAVINSETEVKKLCWDQEGKRLLVGSYSLCIYRQASSFNIDDRIDNAVVHWTCVWKRKLASPIKLLEFSPDGHYFASAGQKDCMVKIWFRAPIFDAAPTSPMMLDSNHFQEEKYNFIYILHPATVQSFSWRKISKHMPVCSVPNVLLTSCVDNVCRIWSETVKYKPSHYEAQSFATEQPSAKERSEFHSNNERDNNQTLTNKFQIHQRYHLVSMFHFHLAAVINPSSDIALLSTIPTSSIFGRNFRLQWLNNKEVQLTTAVEAIYESLHTYTTISNNTTLETDPFLHIDEVDGEMNCNEDFNESNKTLDRTLDEDEIFEDSEATLKTQSNKPETPNEIATHGTNTYKNQLNNLLHDWCKSSDTLYCIHPADGSLLIWVIDYLDDFTSAYYRQVQVSFASRIPSTFSKADASSLCWTDTYHYTQPVQKAIQHLATNTSFMSRHSPKKSNKHLLSQNSVMKSDQLSVLQVSYLVSAHADGSLNLWLVTFSDSGSFTGVASITHVTRSCGPRFETTQLASHPILPLVIGTSQQKRSNYVTRSDSCTHEQNPKITDIESELILWHASHVSPLSEFKGVTEMARISSAVQSQFLLISWVPALFQHSLLSMTSDTVELIPHTPCTCFVAASCDGLQLYQILLDAKSLLSNISMHHQTPIKNGASNLSDFIASEQSGSHSACIIKLCSLKDSEQLKNIEFLHVFNKKSLLNKENFVSGNQHKDDETFYVVAVNRENNKQKLCIWSVEVSFDGRFDVCTPESPESIYNESLSMSPTTPRPLSVSHCLQQKFIYCEQLDKDGEVVSNFAPAADIRCSTNLNSSCPVQYNFLGILPNGSVKLWNLSVLLDDTIDVQIIGNLTVVDNAAPCDVLCIACTGADRFAYITKSTSSDDLLCSYELVIKENESSGELVWKTECCLTILKDIEANNSQIIKINWLSMGNGCYLLAVALNNIVYIYSRHRYTDSSGSTMGTLTCNWEILKKICLSNNDSMLRLTTISWTSCGFLFIGVENEIQVYSQWLDNKEVKFRRQTSSNVVEKSDEGSEHGIIITQNSFTVACDAMKSLPQYHPRHLLELLNLGKMRRARAILRHLVRCVAGITAADAAAENGDVIEPTVKPRTRTFTRTLSNLSEISSSPAAPTEITIAEPQDSGPNIEVIPPLSMTSLLAADKDESGKLENDFETVTLFTTSETDTKKKGTGMSQSPVYYGLAQAHLLTEHLSKLQLPGLSSKEQMYLLALSDTIASTNLEFEAMESNDMKLKYTKQESIDSSLSGLSGGGGGYATTGATGVSAFGSDTLDDCGLRFLLSIRRHTALMKSLSQRQKASLKEQDMASSEYCWAFHSDCKEELLAMIPCMLRNEPTWSELKAHGVGWWVRSNDVLRRTIEKVAKAHFQIKKDPLDCALFYLAMKKKTLLCALYRSLRDAKMSTFFNNNFDQERWRKAAMKNAYALLGKQRFEHAVAFFLLGNALWDAVQVCITRLNDIQLALVIVRLYEGSNDTHAKVLEKYVLGYESEPPSQDPFHCSMANWILKDYSQSLDVLLTPVQYESEDLHYEYPSIFNFYHYLRSHPLLRRRHLTQHRTTKTDVSHSLSSDLTLDFSSSELQRTYERKLYFRTASTHLDTGLPDIALEVLLLLPKISEDMQIHAELDDSKPLHEHTEDMIITGTFSGDLENHPKNDTFKTNGFMSNIVDSDWSSAAATNRFADLDDEYKIGISLDDSDSDSEEEIKEDEKCEVSSVPKNLGINDNDLISDVESSSVKNEDKLSSNNENYDIVALNMKYNCIVRCLIEELKSLPSTCTQGNLKLRSTLNSLLQDELAFLHAHCDYGYDNKDAKLHQVQWDEFTIQQEIENLRDARRALSVSSIGSFDSVELTLGEKVEQVALHSEWLKRNQSILTSLYEHCLMVGAGDAELPAICLELLLLLHEIEGHRVLSSPLTSISAGPSAPPLLLASMASFSLVASPTAFLQSMAHDLLQTVVDLPSLPTPLYPVTRLADLESLMFSLSACVYHSLCGGEDDRLLASIRRGETQLVGKQMKDGKLCRLPYGCSDVDIEATSSPSQWPGVKFFLSILAASNKDGSQSIKLLLCEVAVAVYLSILVSSSSRLSCNNLYRLVLNGLNEKMWTDVFGGGTKVVIPAPDQEGGSSPQLSSPKAERKHDAARMKWNYKLLGRNAPATSNTNAKNENQKLVRHELFIPPQNRLSDYFMTKPETSAISFNYNSEDEDSDEEDEEYFHQNFEDSNIVDDGFIDEALIAKSKEERKRKQEKLHEHFDSSSYAWLIMELSLVKITSSNISSFLLVAGLDMSDLPTESPLLYNATKILLRWEQLLTARLDGYPPLTESLINYYPPANDDGVLRGGITLQRVKTLLDPENTPFSNQISKAKPAKRLWHQLVHEDSLRQLFLHYVFKSSQYTGEDATDYEIITGHILHKDPEPVTNFCFNQSNLNYIAISTVHEVIEYEITGALDLDMYTMDDYNYMSSDSNADSSRERNPSIPSIIQRRPCSGVRRMDSHPTLPYYVTGGSDGSVRMYEFGHPDQIVQFRGAGQNERVNKVQFNPLGNKFAVVDDSGYLSMWLVTNTHDTAPYLTLRCHSKYCFDFAFLGSSSLVATVGFTSDKRNVCVWDTLLPPKKALVHTFSHNLHAAQSLLYVPGQQCLIAGGRRGDICIFDTRQRRLLHTFQAHESIIKTMALDPSEKFFVTGTESGDIKIWGLGIHELIESFPREHMKGTVSLRQVSPGVQCLRALPSGQLLSCGGDGLLKWRTLKLNNAQTSK